jgi:hypothetical protein
MVRAYLKLSDQRKVASRAQGRCEYCQCRADCSANPFVIEHIIPVSGGGESELANLAFACPGCNGHKYNKTHASDPLDGKLVLLYHPRRQKWQDHFAWSEDLLHIVGLTPTGRATVAALQLNRPGVINLRQLLMLVGKHPPE